MKSKKTFEQLKQQKWQLKQRKWHRLFGKLLVELRKLGYQTMDNAGYWECKQQDNRYRFPTLATHINQKA